METDRLMLRVLALIAASLLIALPGCKTKTSDRNLVVVDPAQAQEAMVGKGGLFGGGAPPRAVYLDPREPAVYAKSHIKGAINVPFPQIESRYSRELKDYDVIVVYDSDYSDIIAKAASKRLQELGQKDVLTLKGGLKAWIRDGYPVEGTDIKG